MFAWTYGQTDGQKVFLWPLIMSFTFITHRGLQYIAHIKVSSNEQHPEQDRKINMKFIKQPAELTCVIPVV